MSQDLGWFTRFMRGLCWVGEVVTDGISYTLLCAGTLFSALGSLLQPPGRKKTWCVLSDADECGFGSGETRVEVRLSCRGWPEDELERIANTEAARIFAKLCGVRVGDRQVELDPIAEATGTAPETDEGEEFEDEPADDEDDLDDFDEGHGARDTEATNPQERTARAVSPPHRKAPAR